MRIALDPLVLAARFKHQGTHVYARNLMHEFRKLAGRCSGVEFCLFATTHNTSQREVMEPTAGFDVVESPRLESERCWRAIGANRAAAQAGADLMFCPSNLTLALGKVPVVTTLHDATPVVMPAFVGSVGLRLHVMMRMAARFSRAIVTVSEYSKKDLVEFYGVSPDRITVTYLGYDHTVYHDAPPDPHALRALRERIGIHRPYVFHHGAIHPRKNLKRLIDAYRLLLARNPDTDLDLVLAGPLGWMYDDVVEAARNVAAERGRVLLPGALPDDELAHLIKGAELVVVPSLYEGFCLPMVESMACGAPVIASSSSCLPEVSGNALLYFDPKSVEEMTEKMQSALFDSGLNRQLRQRGLDRARFFSWHRCAEETVRVFCRAAETRP